MHRLDIAPVISPALNQYIMDSQGGTAGYLQ